MSRPSISVCVALPPAPCAIVTVSSLNFGRFERAVSMISRTLRSRSVTAASVISPRLLVARVAAVVVVGGARALRRDHARPDRVLGCARRPEDLALVRLDHALQDLAALACLRVRDPDPGDAE